MFKGIERRKHPRVKFGRVEICRASKATPAFICDAENMSVGGLCVRLKEQLNLFTGVRLKLFLDGSAKPIECKGKINWTMALTSENPQPPYTYETGIQFIHLKDEHRSIILNRVNYKLEEAKEEQTS